MRFAVIVESLTALLMDRIFSYLNEGVLIESLFHVSKVRDRHFNLYVTRR